MENECRCTSCGAITPREDLVKFDDEYLCHACLEEHTVICDRYGERIWMEDTPKMYYLFKINFLLHNKTRPPNLNRYPSRGQ